MDKARIDKVRTADEKAYNAIRDLLAQLYPERPPLEFEKFQRVVNSPNVGVYIATVDGEIVGTSQLASYEKLGGEVWTIEDVIVNESMRGKGIGKKLTEQMLKDAREGGARCVDLTTRKENARRFYIEKCGFKDKAEGRPFWGLRYTFS
ncbi:MAG: GNAT family N-acetyltransferase [Candidatus Colwellbacteria bacterium]|nr:GNAT family N-acetyltransferase [Candidatus Colwellbacteria bacterium]